MKKIFFAFLILPSLSFAQNISDFPYQGETVIFDNLEYIVCSESEASHILLYLIPRTGYDPSRPETLEGAMIDYREFCTFYDENLGDFSNDYPNITPVFLRIHEFVVPTPTNYWIPYTLFLFSVLPVNDPQLSIIEHWNAFCEASPVQIIYPNGRIFTMARPRLNAIYLKLVVPPPVPTEEYFTRDGRMYGRAHPQAYLGYEFSFDCTLENFDTVCQLWAEFREQEAQNGVDPATLDFVCDVPILHTYYDANSSTPRGYAACFVFGDIPSSSENLYYNLNSNFYNFCSQRAQTTGYFPNFSNSFVYYKSFFTVESGYVGSSNLNGREIATNSDSHLIENLGTFDNEYSIRSVAVIDSEIETSDPTMGGESVVSSLVESGVDGTTIIIEHNTEINTEIDLGEVGAAGSYSNDSEATAPEVPEFSETHEESTPSFRYIIQEGDGWALDRELLWADIDEKLNEIFPIADYNDFIEQLQGGVLTPFTFSFHPPFTLPDVRWGFHIDFSALNQNTLVGVMRLLLGFALSIETLYLCVRLFA